MGADDSINGSLVQPFQDRFTLARRAESVQQRHLDGVRRKPFRQGAPVLLCQHRGGGKHGHLFASCDRFEDGSDGHLCFAEAHIAADEAVHGLAFFHVTLHLGRCLELIRRRFIGEGILQLGLPGSIHGVSKAGCLVPLRIELDQVERHFAHRLAGTLLGFDPGRAAHFAELGRAVAVGAIAPQAAELIGRDPKDAIGVLHHEVIADFSADRQFFQLLEPANAMVSMHHEIARLHLVGVDRAACRFATPTHIPTAGEVLLAKEFPVGDQHHAPGGQLQPLQFCGALGFEGHRS